MRCEELKNISKKLQLACTLKNPCCGGRKISRGRLLLNILLDYDPLSSVHTFYLGILGYTCVVILCGPCGAMMRMSHVWMLTCAGRSACPSDVRTSCDRGSVAAQFCSRRTDYGESLFIYLFICDLFIY